MGKRKTNKKSGGEQDFDDSASCSSSTTFAPMGAEAEFEELDDFEKSIDELFEKRAATRITAFERLVRLLLEQVRYEECDKSASTICSRSLQAIRKGSAEECAAGCKLIGLLVLTLGTDATSVYRDALGDLEKAARSGKGAVAQAAAVEALAITTFVASDHDEATLAAMARLQSAWKQDSPRVRAVAIQAWTFLLTSLQGSGSLDVLERAMEELGDHLQSGETAVRMAAGQAITLLYSSCGLQDEAVDEDEEEEEMEVSSISGASSALSGLDDVVDRMRELASNKGDGKRRSRRARAGLRSKFRELCGVVQGGRVREQRITLRHGDMLVVDTLEGCIMMDFLRAYLGHGFQAHLQANPLLHDVFQFQPLAERAGRLTAVEKRMYRSPQSYGNKARAQERKHDRSSKDRTGAAWLGD